MKFGWLDWFKSAERPEPRIGIDGLPDEAALLTAGSLYCIAAGDGDGRRRLLSGTVSAALAHGHRVVVVSADPGACWQELTALDTGCEASLRQGRLMLLNLLPASGERLMQFGGRRFLQELEDSGVSGGDVLLLEGADALFEADPDFAVSCRRWLAAWQIRGLFLLADQGFDSLAAYSDEMAGVAELRHDLNHYQWWVGYWRTASGVARNIGYEVHGGLRLSALAGVAKSRLQDEDKVYYTADSIGPEERLPENWQLCEDYRQLVAKASQAGAAGFVAHYRQPQDFLLLAKTVYQLRFIAGRSIKIVVRERGLSFRYSQELLLTKLGVNRVVYRDFGLSRLLWAVESLKGQDFGGRIEANFETSLAAAIPEEVCGYLPPGEFCRVVTETLHKTESVGMHHVLLRLDILPEKAHLEVLLSCRPKRDNDIVTADQAHLYLFLFACREQDIDSALAGIVAEPLEQCFGGQSHWAGTENILDAVADLSRRAQDGRLADFSEVLPEASSSENEASARSVRRLQAKKRRWSPPKAKPASVRTVSRHALALRNEAG